MAKCKNCNNEGFFQKLTNGLCNKCLKIKSDLAPKSLISNEIDVSDKMSYNHNLKRDKYYYKAKEIYDEVINEYKKLIDRYSYNEYSIQPHEKVFVIEDSFVIFIGLAENHPEHTTIDKEEYYRFFGNSIDMLYHIHMEELTQNELFKFIGTKFSKKFNVDSYHFFNIKRFIGENNSYGKFGDGSVFKYVCEQLPSLNLHQRFLDWKGNLYHFIVYEVTDFTDKCAYCLYKTKHQNPNKIAMDKVTSIEQMVLAYQGDFNYEFIPEEIGYQFDGISFNETFRKVSLSIINYIKDNHLELKLYGKIKFCIIKRYIKEIQDLDSVTAELFKQAVQCKFDNIPKFEYTEKPIKWKSEYLLKEICEKLYGTDNVIYQHRPFFLHTNKGQLSYDIYLIKKKIAIEYQGKQHFEPIEYFGGETSFKKQQERDIIKKQLSEQNNIRLIYINYSDPLTQEFISQKIEEVTK